MAKPYSEKWYAQKLTIEQAVCCGEAVDVDTECPYCGNKVAPINEDGGE